MGTTVRWLLLVGLVLGACGADPDEGATSSTTDDEVSTTTGQPSTTGQPPTTDAGPGLAVRVRGLVDGDAFCPGGVRPCVPLDGAVEDDGIEVVVVRGRLLDGRLEVDEQEDVPPAPWRGPDRCQATSTQDDGLLVGELSRYEERTPEAATAWVSPAGTYHLGVTGEAAPHEAALDELGIGEHVCVVGGFERSNVELREVVDVARPVVTRLAELSGASLRSIGADPFRATVVAELDRIDRPLVDEVATAYGDLVTLEATIEVLDGSLAELEAELALVAADERPPELRVTCGGAELDGLPPDLDALPPVDDEARAALDAAVSGAAGLEAEPFVTGYEWFIADRTDDRMLLFGRDGQPSPGYASMAFVRLDDGSWTTTGFGGCHIRVSAVGFGPAAAGFDPDRPPEPASTELPLLIVEQACASGQAPVDREIVPVVRETETSVEVIVLVARVDGNASCPGNPPHPITVTLDEPFGERTLLDGSRQPPIERTWPASLADLFP